MRTTIVFAFLLMGIVLSAQTGEIRGTVIDEGFGEPIIGANVLVKELIDAGVGASTDLDGQFSISLEPGTYTIEVSYIGLSNLVVNDVEVTAGQVTQLGELFMTEGSLQLEEVVVSAAQIRSTESALIAIKRNAPAMLDGISSSRMQLTGDATAIEAAKRVTGVSIEGGKYIYVRGLGDRYTKTTLNGIDIPGLDPDRNSLQLDIFPTNLIDNLVVSKNFTADMPADFTGGLVNLELKAFPEERILSFSLSAGFTPGMNFNSDFLTYDGGGTDWLGIDDGTRELPSQARGENIPTPGPGVSDQEVFDFVKSFKGELGAKTRTSVPDFNASFTFGNQISVGNNPEKDAKLGYMFSVSYRNETNFYDDVIYGEWQRESDPNVYDLTYANVQEGKLGENSTLIGGLAGLAYKTQRNKVRFSALHLQNGDKRAGQFRIDDNGEAVGRSGFIGLSDNLEFNQRGLTNLMMHGSHLIGDMSNGWELDWKVSPTWSTSSDPDIRKTAFTESNGRWLFVAGAAGNPSRIWRDLSELSLSARVDVQKGLRLFDRDAKVKFGAAHTYKDRDYEILLYDMQFAFLGQVWEGPDPTVVLNDDNIYPNRPNGIYYQAGNRTPNPNEYQSNSNNTAFYGLLEFNPLNRLKATVGLRAENFTLRHTGRDQRWANGDFENGNNLDNDIVLDALDLFPSAGLIYSLTDKMNLRGSYSKTIARPSFKELSYAQILDPISNRIFNGALFAYGDWDGNLSETRIDNMDLRWEMFLEGGQLISASVFYKKFDNPIELVRIPEQQTSTEFQPRNVGDGQLFGLELEVRKNLGFISGALENLAVVGNVTFVESQIDMTDREFNARKSYERTGETIENTREMQGQAPYVINAGITYSGLGNGWEAGAFYNVKGRTLEVVGVGLYSDVYTVPFHSLNVSVSKKFGADNRSQLDFKVNNLLNSTLQSVYGSFRAEDQVFTSIRPGTAFSLSFRQKF
ncbi:MAG: TonB-dependent receptor [Cyclobacteriaceae bacterium]